MKRTYEMVMPDLIETYDYKEIKFEEENDDRILYDAINFMGNRVWVKVIIDDEVSLMDWDVYEQDPDEFSWEYIGTVCLEGP